MSRMKDKTFISVLVMTDVISTYTHFQKLGNGDDAEKWNHEMMFQNKIPQFSNFALAK